MSNYECGKILGIIGGVIILLGGIFSILGALGMGVYYSIPTSQYFHIAIGALTAIIWGILELIVGIIILGECGVGKRRSSNAGVALLILGIVCIILFNLLGGILVLIGAILMLV